MADKRMLKKTVRLEIRYFSEAGPKRSQNQDNYYMDGVINQLSRKEMSGEGDVILNGVSIIALFDGMGGEISGEKASLTAAECMQYVRDNLGPGFSRQGVEHVLKEYYEYFLEKLSEKVQINREKDEVCGTTCAGLVIDGQRAVPFWVGDSRGYLLRENQLIPLTKDHSVAQEKMDYGLMTEEEARKSKVWHMLTAYMGEAGTEISVGKELEILPGDRLFLCSDGITDECRDDELREILSGDMTLALECFRRVMNERSDDNCTVILADVTGETVQGEYEEMVGKMKDWFRTLGGNLSLKD